ncbi:GTP cyclohydrolase-2 [Rhodospirillaceae bacterium LM-1]|nr:GTP cyclohydrolase-2 [Rhodospirillaceae bacterium LM-1]
MIALCCVFLLPNPDSRYVARFSNMYASSSMTHALERPSDTMSASPCLRQVDRALSELRRGGLVILQGENGESGLVLAAEAVTQQALNQLRQLAASRPVLAITNRRAEVLGLGSAQSEAVSLTLDDGADAEFVQSIADPLAPRPATNRPMGLAPIGGACCAGAAVRLTKLARLLPAALMAPLPQEGQREALAKSHDLLTVTVADILAYPESAARSMRQVAWARVPLEAELETKILAFRPADGGIEHLAILIGNPDASQPVLVRLHSECFTGDLLGSLRCDCGDQLRGAISEIAKTGGGALLYLAQEGRGIGLVNKLRAYRLQDAGLDTLDANGELGFEDDERVYLPAAEMLRQLGFSSVRLLTNNPLKVKALAKHGIDVAQRVPHVFPSNGHNEFYLRTKADKAGHLF